MRIELDARTVNAAYLPFVSDQRRTQIFFGGSSSGKSVFLAARCVLDALQGRNYLVTRKVSRTLRGSCWNECVKAIARMGLSSWFSVAKTEMSMTANNNGAQILFAGLDDVEKIKSITPRVGPLTDIWMEEATEADYRDFKQLEKRLRGHSRHKKRVTISFNPIYKTHWLYTTFFDGWDDKKTLFSSPSLLILKTTYKDNRFLSADDRAALENETDPYYRAVYTLGDWGAVGDVIFTAWRAEDLKDLKRTADRLYFGLDFGFSSDPAAVVKVSYDRAGKRVYVLEELLEKGLTNDELAFRVRQMAGGAYVTCDSAEPKSIAELKRLGVSALPAKKGADSVLHGIQWLKQHTLIVDVSCVGLRRELALYQWKKDKDGNSLRTPEDKNNHLIDALRYALESESLMRYAKTGRKEDMGL